MPYDHFDKKPIRIQKYLSEQGILSRREAEDCIKDGLIKVNGKRVTEMGTKIIPGVDIVELAPTLHNKPQKAHYLAFHNPKGIVSNCPLPGETQITDLLPAKLQHLSTVGRLDKDSEGLILLTEDGVFAKRCLQPNIQKVYLVWINAPLGSRIIRELEEEGMVAGKKTKPCTITQLDETYLMITLIEGKNRQIRRMIQQTGRFVVRLKRVQFGKITLEKLPKGHYRDLTPEEMKIAPVK